ncbi:MAG: hypothetical protein HY590_03785 [Candidatus Omnitrophica bacterium]|nr:hypothetical protein [Candidatus Omnitrophota bacterium]
MKQLLRKWGVGFLLGLMVIGSEPFAGLVKAEDVSPTKEEEVDRRERFKDRRASFEDRRLGFWDRRFFFRDRRKESKGRRDGLDASRRTESGDRK